MGQMKLDDFRVRNSSARINLEVNHATQYLTQVFRLGLVRRATEMARASLAKRHAVKRYKMPRLAVHYGLRRCLNQ